jgi:hypothetical protein
MAEKPDPRLTRRFLETYLDGLPGHAIEVRSRLEARPLYSQFNGRIWKVVRRERGVAITGLFTEADLLDRGLRKVEHISMYAVINPVPLGDKQARFPLNEFRQAQSGTCTADADIRRVRWLLVDVDREGHDHGNASLEEINHCWRVAMKVARFAGISPMNVGMSGNGAFLIVPVDLENTAANKLLAKRFLEHIADKITNEHAHIDPKTYNPARLFPLPGTVKYKAREETPERPYRRVTMKGWDPRAGDELRLGGRTGVLTLDRRPVDLRALLLADGVDLDEPVAEERSSRSQEVQSRVISVASATAVAPVTSAPVTTVAIAAKPGPEVLERATAWLAGKPGAIERARQTETDRKMMKTGGAAYTCAVIGGLVREFGIRDRQTLMTLLGPWNATCNPPWESRDLLAKVDYVLSSPRPKRKEGRRGRKPRKPRDRRVMPQIDFEGLEGIG